MPISLRQADDARRQSGARPQWIRIFRTCSAAIASEISTCLSCACGLTAKERVWAHKSRAVNGCSLRAEARRKATGQSRACFRPACAVSVSASPKHSNHVTSIGNTPIVVTRPSQTASSPTFLSLSSLPKHPIRQVRSCTVAAPAAARSGHSSSPRKRKTVRGSESSRRGIPAIAIQAPSQPCMLVASQAPGLCRFSTPAQVRHSAFKE